ncbi:hypothetical protein [Burkholderia sp. ABCPW 14]|uniref:hypothetical protein n=1 Tax=Burkholderia sp. ABCPW 14 TaxID=1637860 RepID=UPI001E32FC2D|nr:hypothetical protein [Burkholderia sp. ABCPW 14]
MLKTFVRRRFQIPLRPPRTRGHIRQAAQRRVQRPHARRTRFPHVRPTRPRGIDPSPGVATKAVAAIRDHPRPFTKVREDSRRSVAVHASAENRRAWLHLDCTSTRVTARTPCSRA